MEAAKKQGDTITDLENELSKQRKQERAYQAAVDALQRDLEQVQVENMRLRNTASGQEKKG